MPSMDVGPCSVVHGGGMRGFNSGSSSSVFSSRDYQAHQQQAVRFGVGVAFAAPAAPATASSAAWDANDEPLPDMLSAPTLRSVSSLVMSIDADESVSAAARNNNNNSSTNSGAATKDVAVSSGAMRSDMVDMLMTPLPAPPTHMDTSDQLTREQSFPPPFRPRFARDQSFPPMDMNMLPSSSSSPRPGWSTTVPTSNSNSGGGSMVGGDFFAGTAGGAPSLSRFPGLGFHWGGGPDQDTQGAPGGQVHPGGGSGGASLGNGGHQHGVVYYDPAPSSSSRIRHSSFDKLAEMIPGIPHWTTPSSSPSASSPPPPTVEAGELHGGGGGGGGGSSVTKTEPTDVRTPTPTPRPTPPQGRGRQQQQQQQPAPTSTRPEKKMKKQHLRGANSPPRASWPPSTTSPPAVAASSSKRTQPTGSGKRAVEPPLPCGPARAGEGPTDLAKQERRRVKIQRYLYKRSRRKFAKFTRDASPSRSRPKAAALRPRIKGKFVKTAPDFISVNTGQPWEGRGGADTADQQDATTPPSPKHPAAGGVGVGVGVGVGGEGRRGGGGGGGGVRSVRNGGGINVNFNNKKAFSTIPSSSLLQRGGGGGARLPRVSALSLNDGASNAFSWQTEPM